MVSHAGPVMTPKMGCSRRPRRAFFRCCKVNIKFVAVSKVLLVNKGLKQFQAIFRHGFRLMAMVNIFTYGTLMFEEIWSQVAAGEYDRIPAILSGYDRKLARGEVYPVLFPSADISLVEGFVYIGATDADLEKLDAFEGEYYFRQPAEAVIYEATKLPVEVYVLKEEYYSIISHQEWDPVRFKTEGMQLFLNRFTGFSQ